MEEPMSETVLTQQYIAKKGLKVLSKAGDNAIVKEVSNYTTN
jgi:hypothetical protein